MSKLLTGRTAVVTGGTSGNGRAIATAFAEHGADVVVADVREEPRRGGKPTRDRILAGTDADAAFVECDVTDRGDVERAIDVAGEFGGVDVMVNNAGIFRGEDFLSVSEAEFDRMMDVNVKGVFFGTQIAAGRMIENGGGSIVNLSSVAGIEGSGDHVSYCTSKGAVRLLTYATADALGSEGVRVNAVHPGIIDTAMTTDDVPIVGSDRSDRYRETIPLGAFGEPRDVANAAVYLASELSSYVTGESLLVDGGRVTSSG